MTREEFQFRIGLISEWDQMLADITVAHRENPDQTEDALHRLMELKPEELKKLTGTDMLMAHRLMRAGLCTALTTITDNLREEDASE